MADKETIVQLQSVRAIDLSSVGQEIESEVAVKMASTAFGMGWAARASGSPLSRRPSFADESLLTDWIAGWEKKDDLLRGG